MKAIRHLARFTYINYVLLKHACSLHKNRGVRMREACEDLGPIFIKFGQLLSTRVDMLPDDIANELIKLQDRVPAFCGQRAQKMIETSLGKPIHELYATFDKVP